MKLHDPIKISSRLLPSVRIGDAFLSVEPTGTLRDNKPQWRWYIDFLYGGPSFTESDLYGPQSHQKALECMLSFLGAFAESVRCEEFKGRKSENSDLFPEELREWSYLHSDEITMLELELQENVLIEDDE